MGRIIKKIKVVNYIDEALARHNGMASDQKKRYIETEVLDEKNEKLIGNPEHDGKWMSEEY